MSDTTQLRIKLASAMARQRRAETIEDWLVDQRVMNDALDGLAEQGFDPCAEDDRAIATAELMEVTCHG